MSERAPYSRVYWSIVDDPKFASIYDDDRHLAAWLRLLVVADQAHPASAPIPHGTRKASLSALVEAGLVDLGTGTRFRIHGLDAERERRRLYATSRGPSGTRTVPKPNPNGFRTTGLRLDETSQDKQSTAPDPWDDPEHEVLVWLSKHGCDVRPGNGYHRKLVTAVEVHGANALVGMMDRLADAGTKQGDIKGFLFGAIDALDARGRPSLTALAKADRADEVAASSQRQVQSTQRYLANLRGES